jgi:RNA polymerase sigma factor (sigma-70 family)
LQEGQFPTLGDRDEIWRLLMEVAICKSANQLRDQNRLKRGGGKVSGESIFLRAESRDASGLDGFVADQPSPELALQVVEEIERLFSLLDEQAQQIVTCRVEGCTDAQTAEILGCSKATVERRLKVIRAKWRAEVS